MRPDGSCLIWHLFQHTGNFPGSRKALFLWSYFTDPAPFYSLFCCKLSCCILIVVAAFCAKIILHQHTHAISRYHTKMQMLIIPLCIISRNGNITKHIGIPVNARSIHNTDCRNLNIKNHIFYQIFIIKILMLETFLTISFPSVNI